MNMNSPKISYSSIKKERKKIKRNNLIFSTSCIQSNNEHRSEKTLQTLSNTVQSLLKYPFHALPYADKVKVIQQGRPQPSFEVSLEDNATKSTYSFAIDMVLYNSIPWICGCQTIKRLFCWPCLLFSKEITEWNTFGFSDFHNMIIAEKQHSALYYHMMSLKELKSFEKNNYTDLKLNSDSKLITDKRNLVVKQNRTILNQLIAIISVMGSLGLDWTTLGNSTPLNPGGKISNGKCYKLIKILTKYNNSLVTKGGVSVLNVFSPSLCENLIYCISDVMLQEIRKEVSQVNFVTVMLYEVSNISVKRHVATILRYLNVEGNVVERFVDFKTINSDRNCAELYQHIIQIVNDFDISSKLIAYTCDGALLRINKHSWLQRQIQDNYKQATFINCYSSNAKKVGDISTNFNSILIQSLCLKNSVRLFFSLLEQVSKFFKMSSKCLEVLEPDLFLLMTPSSNVYSSTSYFVEVLYENHNKIEKALTALLMKPMNWDLETISTAHNIVSFITKSDFKFFLKVFYLILPATHELFDTIQNNILHDVGFIQGKIAEVGKFLEKLRKDFKSIWAAVYEKPQNCQTMKSESQLKNHVLMRHLQNWVHQDNGHDQENKINRNQLEIKNMFYEIIDLIVLNITVRFNDVTKLEFLELLDPTKFVEHKIKFPENALIKLKNSNTVAFNYESLRKELFTIYHDKDITTKELNVIKLFNYIKKSDFVTVYPETCRLCDLILTMPIINAAVNETHNVPPALDRINDYVTSYNIVYCNLLLTPSAMLHIENCYLEKLRSKYKEKFDEHIIESFANETNKIDLTYKS